MMYKYESNGISVSIHWYKECGDVSRDEMEMALKLVNEARDALILKMGICDSEKSAKYNG